MASSPSKKFATALGFEGSTDSFTVVVRSEAGDVDIASCSMEGATTIDDQPAFDVTRVSPMFLWCLRDLMGHGWDFSQGGSLSYSWRQHDMTLVDCNNIPLLPSLSWQSNGAKAEVAQLKQQGAEAIVGTIEPRFILPKLMFLLTKRSELRDQIHRVMPTGDWVLGMLTGTFFMSSSDALSNGLLAQEDRLLATRVFRTAGLQDRWFLPVISSGSVLGPVVKRPCYGFEAIVEILEGWQCVSGLGDNHASAVGCGLRGLDTMVISAGSSGTVNFVCDPTLCIDDDVACFEFYDRRLLLTMLHDCATVYRHFKRVEAPDASYEEIDAAIKYLSIPSIDLLSLDGASYSKPQLWDGMTVCYRAAHVQYTIAAALLGTAGSMIEALPDSVRYRVQTCVMTGGLSSSQLFREVIHVGLGLLGIQVDLHISTLPGKIAQQTGAWGALVNSQLPGMDSLKQVTSELCPTTLFKIDPQRESEIGRILKRDHVVL